MGRSPCCSDKGRLKKGPWSPEEDEILIDFIQKHGLGSWGALSKGSGLNRCGKSCRLRWTNYLRPDIKRGNFSQDEEQTIINLHSTLGNKWSKIASHLPGRTDNEIKNFWNTRLRKKLLQMGIDPKTHKPISDLNLIDNFSKLLYPSNLGQSMNPLNNSLSLQSNATQIAKLQILHNIMQFINTTQLQNIKEINPFGSNIFSQFDGLNSEIINRQTMDINPQLLASDHHTNARFEGGFSQEVMDIDFNSLSSSFSNPTTENLLPALVSSTLEISAINQIDSTNPTYIVDHSSNSNIFEAWKNLVDDEASCSVWKDIID